MFNPVKVGKRTRYSYARIKEVMDMPHLLDIQRNSYDWFKKEGLQEIFKDISPISDFTGNLELFFENFTFGESKYSLDECKRRDGTYAAPIRVRVKLLNKIKGEVKDQEVFMGDFPIMTETGTFIINGAERVIVSQLVRSPGAYYDKTIDQTGKDVFTATIIPNRGAWIELESDSSSNISVRIDRTRKMPVSFLLRALDFDSNQLILDLFDFHFFLESKLNDPISSRQLLAFLNSNNQNFNDSRNNILRLVLANSSSLVIEQLFSNAFGELEGKKLFNAFNSDEGKKIFEALNSGEGKEIFTSLKSGESKKLFDALNTDTGKKLFEKLKSEKKNFKKLDLDDLIRQFNEFDSKGDDLSHYHYLLDILYAVDDKNSLLSYYRALAESLDNDRKSGDDNKEKALIGIYNRIRPGEPPSAENSLSLLNSQFFDAKRYDFAAVGRFKITKKLGWKNRILNRVLAEDLVDSETGELLIRADTLVTQDMLDNIPDDRDQEIFNLSTDPQRKGVYFPIPIKIRSDCGDFTILCTPSLSIRNNRTICVADICAAISYVFDLAAGFGKPDEAIAASEPSANSSKINSVSV